MGKRKTKEEFIEQAKRIHNNKYDYSKVEYVNVSQKVCIICSEHGEFIKTPHKHLLGQGCPICGRKNKQHSVCDLESFINKAKQIHNNRYDYSKVEYKNSQIKVCIICPEHGEFWQRPADHLRGMGCIYCSGRYRATKEEFIEKAKKIHGDRYDYSKVEYINAHIPIVVTCKCKKYNNEIHGDFRIKPNNLLFKHGCPLCRCSKIEIDIERQLTNLNIKYEKQKKFDWLKLKKPQYLDFYLPDYNIAIECQGDTHFSHFAKPVSVSAEFIEDRKNLIVKRDINKYKLLQKNGIKIYYVIPKFFGQYINETIYQGIYKNNVILYDNINKISEQLIKLININ